MKRGLGVALALCALACARGASERSQSSGPAPTPQASAAATAVATPEPIDTTTPLPSPLPRIAARVNGRSIPTSQVMILADELLQKGVFKEKISAYRGTLNQLVVREVLLEEAIARKLGADDAAVQQAYDEARVAYKDDASWTEYLRTQALTPQDFRAELRTKQTIAILLSQEAQQVPTVSEADARLYYDRNPELIQVGEKVKVAHILLAVPPNAKESARAEARARAIDLRGRIQRGQDFAALAERYSGDTTNSTKGGVLEPFARGRMPQSFEDAAFALRPGELSEVVQTPFGFHLIRSIERIPATLSSFDEVKEPLRQQLSAAARQRHLQAFINQLKAKAKIEILL